VRVSLLAAALLLGWAALLPVGQRPQWWHWALAGLVVVGFLGSWNGQHFSTALHRWAPMAWRNRRRHRHPGTGDTAAAAPSGDDELRSRITIHLRPQPHTLNTPDAHDDQLPWQFVTAWLDRYGIRADALTVCSVTRTPPPSSLRSDAAAQLTARTPQHRDTWLTYTLTAESNVGALVARRTALSTIEEPGSAEGPGRQRTGLAAVTARRLIAELREQGWLASLCEDTAELPVFVPATVGVRRECWTGTEYSDGFRAVYAVDPHQIDAVLDTLTAVPTKATWVAVTVRAHRTGPTTVEACVGMLTPARPPLQPLAGLTGFHGLHRQATQALSTAGLDQTGELGALPQSPVDVDALAALPWATSAMGVPIGFDRTRRPVYVGLSSPEPVRVTVTGTGDFHVGVISRLALSGSPIAIYTRDPRRWTQLANHGGPEQIRVNPATVTTTTIVVSDGGGDIPPGSVSVLLRRPQAAPPPATTIVITQDPRRPELFTITTPRGNQWLSLRL
jgi:type VII secretion protein EccE